MNQDYIKGFKKKYAERILSYFTENTNCTQNFMENKIKFCLII
jgi:hypothetical protein